MKAANWRLLAAHKDRLGQHKVVSSSVMPVMQSIEGLCVDYSRHLVDGPWLATWCDLIQSHQVFDRLEQMMHGAIVNPSERRAALHTLLRTPSIQCPTHLRTQWDAIKSANMQMFEWADALAQHRYKGATGQPIEHIIHLGIGGSHLGPKMVHEALMGSHPAQSPRISFVSSLEPLVLDAILARSNPHTTAVLVVSKSFTTQETLCNAQRVRAWLSATLGAQHSAHLWAVSAALDKAVAWGVPRAQVLPIWDWVGGRFSLWSSVNAPLAMTLGQAGFEALLAGAHAADQNALNRSLGDNIALLSACLDVWYNGCYGVQAQAVVPYAHCLRHMTDYLQQLWMESLGKCVDLQGQPLPHASGTVLFGGTGTESQHAFFQLLMQGGRLIPIDMFVALSNWQNSEAQRWLVAHGLSQASTLGGQRKTVTQHHGSLAAPQPLTLWLLRDITPYTLGALIALFEHRVFFQSVLLGLNPFDQWGVEQGKRCANTLAQALDGGDADALSQHGLDEVASFILKTQ